MTHLLLIIIYMAFVSLGLPDSILGASWPSMYPGLDVPVSYAGIISMSIAFCTIISSLQSYRITQKLGTGKVTAISAALTAVALLGFSVSAKFWQLCFWAIPYGIGAGSVDSCLNNYVATHYKSHHMSWLHCMWGVGATVGPMIMGRALTCGFGWNWGYRWVAFMQIALTAILFLSLPLWRARENGETRPGGAIPLREILATPGVRAMMLCFFGYCALEQTAGLWAASYLALHKGVPSDVAAGFGGMFFMGITAGRAISGFVSMKLSDSKMIWLGMGIISAGIAVMLLPLGEALSLMGLALVGLGCAPVYPSIMHSIPGIFGPERSQAIIGVQMAGAYVGTCLMPSLFGVIANNITVALLPLYLLALLLVMAAMQRMTDRMA